MSMHIELVTVVFIAVGLAMDSFAVSITSGSTMGKLRVRHAFRIALFFGGFQGLMPLIGYLSGLSLRTYLAHIDHWIAFGLLAGIGCKMIYESMKMGDSERNFDPTNLLVLLGLSVATSIDALAVGISLSMIKVDIIVPALVIGLITFGFSLAGVYIGKRLGHIFERKIELLGGVILIGIGVKILLEHLHG
ncbi:MAG TPA: manganese efflux pump [Deltaproteobacteria bacterium]|nr:manganese efflux pump [Deltaproteobacteria bacterium]